MRAVAPSAAAVKALALLRQAQAQPVKPIMVLPQPAEWDQMTQEAQLALWESIAQPQQARLIAGSQEDRDGKS